MKRFERPKRNLIVYNSQVTDFEDIFKVLPLENQENKAHFMKVALISKDSRKNTILNKSYTSNLLKKISQNSLKDLYQFYDLANKTAIHFINDKNKTHEWFKTHLTSFWLANKNAPQELNYWVELSKDQKNESMYGVVKYVGSKGFKEATSKVDYSLTNFLSYMLNKKIGHFEYLQTMRAFINILKNNQNPIDLNEFKNNFNLEKINTQRALFYYEYKNDLFDISKLNINISPIQKVVNQEIVNNNSTQEVLFMDIIRVILFKESLEQLNKNYENKNNINIEQIKNITYMKNPIISINDLCSYIDKDNQFIKNNVEKVIKDKLKENDNPFLRNALLMISLVEDTHNNNKKKLKI